MNNLEGKLRSAVEQKISEIIKEANKDPNLQIEKTKYETKNFNLFEQLNLPKKKVRKIDEDYIPDPVRYLFGDPCWCGVLMMNEKNEEKEEMSFKNHGYIQNYEIYSYFLSPTNSIYLIEDDDEDFKVVKRFDISFDFE
ncbi:MAG: hypothetical protein WCG45_05415 [bacterium]